MTIVLILAAAIILTAAYQILSKKGNGTINQIKKTATDALDKIEPVLHEAGEVIEKAKKVAPKNKAIAESATKVKEAEAIVKKARNKKTK
jgi:hypothetical protein